MVKIFIGHLALETTAAELRQRFEKYGKVSECDIVKTFGFVHMDNPSEAEEAIKNLNQTELNGWRMNVQMGKPKTNASTKLHVSNLGEGATSEDLRAKFEEFGPVVECDIVKNYAFVHMERLKDAMRAIEKLDNTAFKGKLMNVRLSTSRLRTVPGMGDSTGCYLCGRQGHWSKDCPEAQDDGYGDGAEAFGSPEPPYAMPAPPAADYSAYGRAGYTGGYPPPAPAPPAPHPAPPPRRADSYASQLQDWYASRAAASYAYRSYYYAQNRLYSSADYYQKYRAHPYGSSYYDERRLSYPATAPAAAPSPTPPKPSPTADPYEHWPGSAPSSAAAYYAQEHSRPIPVVSSSTYSYPRKRPSPLPAATSSSSKQPYAQRYTPY